MSTVSRFWYIQPDRIAGGSHLIDPVTGEAASYRVSTKIPIVDGLHAIQVYGEEVHVEWSDEYLRAIGGSVGESGLPLGFLAAIKEDVQDQHSKRNAIIALVSAANSISRQVREFLDEHPLAPEVQEECLDWADLDNLMYTLSRQENYPHTVQWPKPPEVLRGVIKI